ncbi:MAG: DUF3088 domain-containing protein [Hyphomonadaceae bacterium]
MIARDTLFLIRASFEDPALEGTWFCRDCATMEGALLANPHWAAHIEVKRMPYPRPREQIIALLGEAHQSMPVLILAEGASTLEETSLAGGRRFLTDPKAICRYLAGAHGGAGPHP